MKATFFLIITMAAAWAARGEELRSDTLVPYMVLAGTDGESIQVIFNNSNILYTLEDKAELKKVEKAIKREQALLVTYDTSEFNLVTIEVLKETGKEKFFEKHGTFSFEDFEYKESKSLTKNDKLLVEAIETNAPKLKKYIPLDSLQHLFDYMRSLSCDSTDGCRLDAPCLTFNYKADGCYARAHWMGKILDERFGYESEKIFVHGRLKAINEGNCGKACISWGYHVAPYIQGIDSLGNVTAWVLDPSLADKMTTVQEWLALQEQKCCNTCSEGKHLRYEITPSYQYFPNGATDMAYRNTKATLNKYCKRCL